MIRYLEENTGSKLLDINLSHAILIARNSRHDKEYKCWLLILKYSGDVIMLFNKTYLEHSVTQVRIRLKASGSMGKGAEVSWCFQSSESSIMIVYTSSGFCPRLPFLCILPISLVWITPHMLTTLNSTSLVQISPLIPKLEYMYCPTWHFLLDVPQLPKLSKSTKCGPHVSTSALFSTPNSVFLFFCIFLYFSYLQLIVALGIIALGIILIFLLPLSHPSPFSFNLTTNHQFFHRPPNISCVPPFLLLPTIFT